MWRALHPQTKRLLALACVLALTIIFFATQIDNYFSPRMFNRIATSAAIAPKIVSPLPLIDEDV